MEIYSGILGFVITSGIYKWHLTSEKPIFRSYKFISHVGKGGVIRAQGLTSSRADPILPSSHNGLNWIVRGCRTARVGEWVLFCPKLPLTGQHRQRNQYWGIVFICFARCPGLGKTYLHRQICSRACTHLRTLTLTQTHTHTHSLTHTHTLTRRSQECCGLDGCFKQWRGGGRSPEPLCPVTRCMFGSKETGVLQIILLKYNAKAWCHKWCTFHNWVRECVSTSQCLDVVWLSCGQSLSMLCNLKRNTQGKCQNTWFEYKHAYQHTHVL
jgi:hypothetical protein